MKIRAIEAPFWHQRIKLMINFECYNIGTEGTLMGPPHVSTLQLGEDNAIIGYELHVPVRLNGMSRTSMIPMGSIILLQPEEYAQVLEI